MRYFKIPKSVLQERAETVGIRLREPGDTFDYGVVLVNKEDLKMYGYRDILYVLDDDNFYIGLPERLINPNKYLPAFVLTRSAIFMQSIGMVNNAYSQFFGKKSHKVWAENGKLEKKRGTSCLAWIPDEMREAETPLKPFLVYVSQNPGTAIQVRKSMATDLNMSKSEAIRITSKLENEGLIEFAPYTNVRITDKGRRLL